MKQEEMMIQFAKVEKDSDAKIPCKEEENAGYDIYPCFHEAYRKVPAHTTVMIPTGIASALPRNKYFQIEERGSTGTKGIKKSAGVIDSGFRGEWFIAITNTNDDDLYIAKDDIVSSLQAAANLLDKKISIYPYEKAIAQAVLHEVENIPVKEITYEELSKIKSLRGTGMLGDSGK